MPEVTAYTTGQPAWADVTTADVAAASGFYGELFGWTAKTPLREGIAQTVASFRAAVA